MVTQGFVRDPLSGVCIPAIARCNSLRIEHYGQKRSWCCQPARGSRSCFSRLRRGLVCSRWHGVPAPAEAGFFSSKASSWSPGSACTQRGRRSKVQGPSSGSGSRHLCGRGGSAVTSRVDAREHRDRSLFEFVAELLHWEDTW